MKAAKKGPGGWGPRRDNGGVEHPQHVTPTLRRQPQFRQEALRRLVLQLQAVLLFARELRDIRERLRREFGGGQ